MADIYCDNTNGNDTTGTGAAGTPYKTLQKCVDNAAADDTIWIGDTSAQVLAAAITWNTGFGGSTSKASPIKIRGWDYSGGAGVAGVFEIDGNSAVATWDTSTSRPTFVLYDGWIHDTTSDGIFVGFTGAVINMEVSSTGGRGIMGGTQYTMVLGCYIHDTGGDGIQLNSQTLVMHNIIENATTRYLDSQGLGSYIINNLIIGGANSASGDFGIFIVGDSTHIIGNTLVGNSNNGTGIKGGTTEEWHNCYNNIVTGFATGIADGGGGFLAYGHNQFYDNTTADETLTGKIHTNLGNNSTADPAFVGSGDYTPTAFIDGWPVTLGSTTTENKIGAVQEAGGAAGGGLMEPGSMTGGMV